jgi:hypothetical protein
MGIIEVLKGLRKSKDQHFLAVTKEIWERWFWIITPIIWIKKDYKFCTIYRRKFKFHKDIVVVGLKWSGKNVKRRTSGFAKEFISKNKNARCIYCERKLTMENATTDHIVPISDGGNNSKINLVVVCFDCNNERGSTPFTTYLNIKNPKYKSIKRPFI